MTTQTRVSLEQDIQSQAQVLSGAATDYDALLRRVGDARFVLLGEASHGTHEFYRERAQITQRLIREKGFNAVAVEADWPDAYRVNRFVRGVSDDAEAVDALGGFQRFPTWMWRNVDVLDFVGWLRDHNDSLGTDEPKTGFYGLDIYSLRASIDAVIAYLRKVNPQAAQQAIERYNCFDHFGPEPDSYALGLYAGLSESCEEQVVEELLDLMRKRSAYATSDGRVAEDEYFYAEQNARIVKAAERYYRTMLGADVSSWNLRDHHMTETLERLVAHLQRSVPGTKAIVWAHNSHVGDAFATDMSARGEFNIGHLMRRQHPNETILVGFTTHAGTVTAASAWHAPAGRKRVRPSLPGSYESVFHETGIDRFYLPVGDNADADAWQTTRLERAIGVIYRPDTERQSHYFGAHIARQFDAVLHFDHTRAVEPLERGPAGEEPEVPETFPTGV